MASLQGHFVASTQMPGGATAYSNVQRLGLPARGGYPATATPSQPESTFTVRDLPPARTNWTVALLSPIGQKRGPSSPRGRALIAFTSLSIGPGFATTTLIRCWPGGALRKLYVITTRNTFAGMKEPGTRGGTVTSHAL